MPFCFLPRRAIPGGDVKRFVEATGGEVLRADAIQVPLAELFRRVRQRYVLLYRSPGGKPGAVRRIRVDLAPHAKSRLAHLTIRSRSGYLIGAPGWDARPVLAPPAN